MVFDHRGSSIEICSEMGFEGGCVVIRIRGGVEGSSERRLC